MKILIILTNEDRICIPVSSCKKCPLYKQLDVINCLLQEDSKITDADKLFTTCPLTDKW